MIARFPSIDINSISGTLFASALDRVPSGSASNRAIPHCSGGVGVLICHRNCDFNQVRRVLPGSFPSHVGLSLLPCCVANSWATYLKPCCCMRASRSWIFLLVCVNKKFAVIPVTDLSASSAPGPEKGLSYSALQKPSQSYVQSFDERYPSS